MDAKKRVVIELPPRGELGEAVNRHDPELEVFGSSVDLIEIDSTSVDTFVAGAADADAIIAAWGVRLTRPILERLDRCAIIAVASVGVDMVDIAAATDAGIVVTNVPDVFIEEVADHTLTMLLASARRLRRMEELIGSGNWAQGWPELSGSRGCTARRSGSSRSATWRGPSLGGPAPSDCTSSRMTRTSASSR